MDARAPAAALDAYRAEHERLRLDPEARNLRHTYVQPDDGRTWKVEQMLVDPEMINDWVAEFEVDWPPRARRNSRCCACAARQPGVRYRSMNDTVFDILSGGDRSAPAIAAAGKPALDYQGLLAQIDATAGYLRSRGIGQGDRVAIILPNGAELATTFLSVACCATAAPLNPALTEQEIEFCLRDFGARALVVAEGASDTARKIAASLGLAAVHLRTPAGAPAGCIELSGQPSSADAGPERGWEPAGPDAVGLVLHTSGTTSRPKIVPLTHANLCASARYIAASAGTDARGPLPAT